MSFLGGSTPQVNFQPQGFKNPTGFSVSGGGKVTESPTLSSNLAGLQATFGQEASAFGGLAQTVKPGFSQFRQAGLTDIANQYMSAQSDLKNSLAQRRVLGSSFANSQFGQQAAQEATDKANFEAQSYLAELSASNQLIQEQYTASTQGFAAVINQSNIESATAAQLTASNNQIMAQVATANANLQMQSQQGAGMFAGLGLGMLGKWASTGFAGPGGASLGSLLSGAAVLA